LIREALEPIGLFIPVAQIKQTNLLVLFHQYFFKK
jgi:hypothetical protein